MTKRLLYVGMALLAVAALALAADAITGKWTWEQPGRDGGPGRPQTLNLKVEGDKLTGTVSGMARPGGEQPADTPISNGKVSGSTITFDVTRESPMGSRTTKYEGTVTGNELKLKISQPGRDGGAPTVREITAKRSTT